MSSQSNPVLQSATPATHQLDEPAKSTKVDLDRPFYVKGDHLGNVLSIVLTIVGAAFAAPSLYVAALIMNNLYLLSHLRDLRLV